jgi:pyridoxamine 5'-phosphate oxidase
VSKNPLIQFQRWFKKAQQTKTIIDATAMCLSTCSERGFPEGRMVLLKHFDHRGFVFYTNLHSAKGRALKKTPKAALTFHWAPLERQIRIQGTIRPVTQMEADAYFFSRPRESRLGAWASDQSAVLKDRKTLEQRLAHYRQKFQGQDIPRPPYWMGLRLLPFRIEFWQGRPSRLHDRFLYSKVANGWKISRLYP